MFKISNIVLTFYIHFTNEATYKRRLNVPILFHHHPSRFYLNFVVSVSLKKTQLFSSDKELKKPLCLCVCLCVCLSVCDIVEFLALSS